MNKIRRPEEKWNTFDLVKVKVSSEITDEEKNSQQGDLHLEGKRISKKKLTQNLTQTKPVMVDVSVQTSTLSKLQTDLDIGASMTNNSHLQMPVISAHPSDTAFISSPKKD
ncbi:Hypothetical predicted protein [Mytilus galloprovincialis]|uniref:Uncharacterized protein n=1 Tax=Mytilus galloprovincialis TaxID=29158 RepID=A0A8B6DR41_MYTGA|nr:Hypothetical predicted protein [Mytilus galloprovincialis]